MIFLSYDVMGETPRPSARNAKMISMMQKDRRQWGGRYQPTLEMPIGHITRPCAITIQPEN